MQHSSLGFGTVSKRVTGFLHTSQCSTILDLAAMSREEAHCFPNTGDVTMRELDELLAAHGLTWETPRDLEGLEALWEASKDKLRRDRRRVHALAKLVRASRKAQGVA